NRLVPPAINVAGTRFSVVVDTDRSRALSRADRLRDAVEKTIVAANQGLTASPSGDFKIVIALDRLESDRISQSKVEDHYEKTKERQNEVREPSDDEALHDCSRRSRRDVPDSRLEGAPARQRRHRPALQRRLRLRRSADVEGGRQPAGLGGRQDRVAR